MNNVAPTQHCPICHRQVSHSSRYPDYVCEVCVALATDEAGIRVAFTNTTFSGHGVRGEYVGTAKMYPAINCFIKGVECLAEEAYFGGIVIRPIKT